MVQPLRASWERDASARAPRGRRGGSLSRVGERSGRWAGLRRCAAGRRLACSVSRCRVARRRADPGVGGCVLVVRLDCPGWWSAARSIGSAWRSAGVRRVVRGGDSIPRRRTGAAERPITGAMPSEKLGPRKRLDQVHVNATCQRGPPDPAFPQGKILGERRQNWGRSPSGTCVSGGVRNSATLPAFSGCHVNVCMLHCHAGSGPCVNGGHVSLQRVHAGSLNLRFACVQVVHFLIIVCGDRLSGVLDPVCSFGWVELQRGHVAPESVRHGHCGHVATWAVSGFSASVAPLDGPATDRIPAPVHFRPIGWVELPCCPCQRCQ